MPIKKKAQRPARKNPAARTHWALYEGIVQSAKDAVIAVDVQQRIVLFNPAAEIIFRCAAADVLGSPLERFIPSHLHAVHREHIKQYGRRKDAVRTMGGDRVLIGLRADGEEFPIDVTISHVDISGAKRFVAVLRDVTERMRAREDLQRYSDIVDTSDDAIFSRSLDGRILTWNPAAERIFGYAREEMIGKKIDVLYSKTLPRDQRDLTAAAISGEHIVNFETVRCRKDGSDIDVAITISLIRDDEGCVAGSSAIMRDISARKKMERELLESLRQQKRQEEALRESRDRLRELSAALQSIREAEKTRIARELHDELGQSLTALKMDAAVIAHDLLPEQPELRKRADGMKRLIDSTVTSMRRISADLRPVMLDNLGLAPTLEWLTKDCSSRNGIRVDLAMSDEDLRVGGEIATAVFRIVQEALTNVVRHAQATTAKIDVVRTAGQVLVRVADNGKGMAAADQRKSRSFGLLGMRERAYVLGGDFTVSSDEGQGTIIEAILPAPRIEDGE
jgi:PAS domain S-box-containing protein